MPFLYKVQQFQLHTYKRVLLSHTLNRKVVVQFYFPKIRGFDPSSAPHLLFNDGQLLEKMGVKQILHKLYIHNQLKPCVLVAIHSDENRVNELGTSKIMAVNLGQHSEAYQHFILNELLPKITTTTQLFIAGFSLGGLSAMDISLNHPYTFMGVGVFSGAFWWRSKPLNLNMPDANLIIPYKIQALSRPPLNHYWFQTGTLDEINDRNNNGVIDSIDDTQTVINCLLKKGVAQKKITYLEKIGGKHNEKTWALMLPHFLVWASKLAQKKGPPPKR